MSISFKIKKRPLRNVLNKIGPGTKPGGTPKRNCFSELKDSLVFAI